MRAIVSELKKYDPALATKPRWLVLNKIDMIPVDEREVRVRAFVKRLRWKGPVYSISALSREGCETLMRDAYDMVATFAPAEPAQRDARFDDPIDGSVEATAADIPGPS